MSLPVQYASVAAWRDEAHVVDNRAKYREKFSAVVPMMNDVMPLTRPDAGFYLWAPVPGGNDEQFTRELFEATSVTVLPGTYLGRDAHLGNPGRGYVRIALVPEFDECVEGARRIVEFVAR